MTGADEGCGRLRIAGQQGFLKSNPFVTPEYGSARTGRKTAVAHGGRDVGNLVPAGFPLPGAAAEALKRLQEKGLDVVGLQPPGFGPLHVLADPVNPPRVHELGGQRVFIQQVAEFVMVKGIVHHGGQSGLGLRPFPVSNCFHQEFPERPALELHFAQHVEHLAAQGIPGLFQLLQQRKVDVALPGFLRHQVP